MINDNANANTPDECLQKCNLDSSCKFWDFDKGRICRLRSSEGKKGKVETSGSSSGPKHCVLSKSSPC